MRKFIVILYLSILPATIIAQKKLSFGATAGPSMVLLSGNDFYEERGKPAIAFIAGIYADYSFSEILSLYTGLLLERKGGHIKVQFTDPLGNTIGNGRVNWNYDYLTLPVLARLRLGNNRRFFINGGPFLGFLLKQTSVAKGNNIDRDSEDGTDSYKRIDVGLTTGIGYTFKAFKRPANVEIRNSIGLTNIAEYSVFGGTLKTNSIAVLMGIQLN